MGEPVKIHEGTLRALRVRAGLSQAQLATMVGASPRAYWQWENGRAAPPPDKVAALCAALRVHPEELAWPAATPVGSGGRGRGSGMSQKLTDAQVEAIRRSGDSDAAEARKRGVSAMQVWRIRKGRSRKAVGA